MFRRIRYWWQDFILKQWRKYYAVGGHCGLCGKWIPDAVVDIHWTWSLCDDWETECYHTLGETTNDTE